MLTINQLCVLSNKQKILKTHENWCMICVCWLIRLANSLDGGNKLEHWLLVHVDQTNFNTSTPLLYSLLSTLVLLLVVVNSSSNTNADPGVDCGRLVCFIMICVWSMWKLLSYSSAVQCRLQTCWQTGWWHDVRLEQDSLGAYCYTQYLPQLTETEIIIGNLNIDYVSH